jgi:hypothetical protein
MDDASGSLYPNIPLSEAGRGGGRPLLSKFLFSNAVELFRARTNGKVGEPFAAPNMTPRDYKKFRVVGFRYDPCFPGPQEDDRNCVQQIRLIAQPIEAGGFAPDYAIHLLYAVAAGLPAKGDPILLGLLALQAESAKAGAATAGRPLGPHPGLERELAARRAGANEGPLAKKTREFLRKWVGKAALAEIAVANGEADDSRFGTWNFLGGPLREDKWEPKAIPRLGGAASQVSDFMAAIDPEPAREPRLRPLAEGEAPAPEDADAADRLLNPRLSNPGNTDCASCHLASFRSMQLARLSPALDRPSPWKFACPAGIAGFPDPRFLASRDEGDFSNVRAAGRLGKKLAVTALAANSAALVAETLNRIQELAALSDRD